MLDQFTTTPTLLGETKGATPRTDHMSRTNTTATRWRYRRREARGGQRGPPPERGGANADRKSLTEVKHKK